MRNLKLGLFSMLCAVFMFGITTAFDINVGPENYYGTLTLNRVNIMKSYGITGIVLDGTGYEISIASGATPGYGKISVYQICGQGGGNCKQVSQLSTTTPVMNSITDNGLVEKTNGVANKVWKTDASGKPQWLDDATGSISINAYTPTLSRGSPSTIIKINDSTATVTLPSNPHYVGSIVASTSNGTSNTNTTDPYLNYVENSTVKSRIQIKGSGSIGVSANNGTITITSTGGGGGDSLWTTGNNNILKPESTDYKILIGEDGAIYPNILISKSGGSRNEWSIGGGCTYYTHNGNQTIEYSQQLVIGKRGLMCSDGKVIAINTYGLGIGLPANNTYALRVAGGSEMNVLKVNDSATIGSHYFYDQKVGIKTNPDPDGPSLQVNGGIKIGSNGHSTCVAGTIDYTGNNFYGCVNGSWKKFTMGNALQN